MDRLLRRELDAIARDRRSGAAELALRAVTALQSWSRRHPQPSKQELLDIAVRCSGCSLQWRHCCAWQTKSHWPRTHGIPLDIWQCLRPLSVTSCRTAPGGSPGCWDAPCTSAHTSKWVPIPIARRSLPRSFVPDSFSSVSTAQNPARVMKAEPWPTGWPAPACKFGLGPTQPFSAEPHPSRSSWAPMRSFEQDS